MTAVLIVEDQTQILALAQSLLEEEGYKTLTARSADDALVILGMGRLAADSRVDKGVLDR